MMPADAFRAYDTVTEWMGPVRDTEERAQKDAASHNRGCVRQGGYGSAIVITEDPECEGRCATLDGQPVWPPSDRSRGSVEWR